MEVVEARRIALRPMGDIMNRVTRDEEAPLYELAIAIDRMAMGHFISLDSLPNVDSRPSDGRTRDDLEQL